MGFRVSTEETRVGIKQRNTVTSQSLNWNSRKTTRAWITVPMISNTHCEEISVDEMEILSY